MWPASCCCGSVSKVNVLILFTGLCIFHWILLLTLTRCTSLAHRKTSVEHHVTDKIFFLFTRGGWGCLSDRWCVKLFWRHCITVIFPQSLFIIGRNHAHLPPSINGEEVERVCSFRTHTHCLKKKKKHYKDCISWDPWGKWISLKNLLLSFYQYTVESVLTQGALTHMETVLQRLIKAALKMATHSCLLLDTYAAFRKYCKRPISHQLFECLLSGKCHKSIKARATGLFFFYHHHTELCFKIKHSINQLDIKSINTIHNIIYFLYTVFL